jgi:uncharacterized delta-60 repeat protein
MRVNIFNRRGQRSWLRFALGATLMMRWIPELSAQTPGTLDASFPGGSGVTGDVRAVALQPDGKILIGGNFGSVNDIPRSGIARLESSGLLDTTFLATDPGLSFGSVVGMVLQQDGRIVIAGFFEEVNGVARNNIARLNTNGTLDTSFPNTTSASKGTDQDVSALAWQATTGKLLIGGYFNTVNGTPRSTLARLNADGSLDSTFAPVLNGGVRVIAVQTNGQIIIGGFFDTGTPGGRTNLARLNANGTLDASFDAHFDASVNVVSLAFQPDGRLLVGGNFNLINGVSRFNLARLDGNGSLDRNFMEGMPGFYDSSYCEISAIAPQPSGTILVGGSFQFINGEWRTNFCRLNPDGSLDGGFNLLAGTDAQVDAIALQPDNKAVLAGSFSLYADVAKMGIARIFAPSPVVPICDRIPLPLGRTVLELSNANPFSVSPPNGALWDSLQQALYPATNGTITVTWNFTNAPFQVTTLWSIGSLPLLTLDLGMELPPPPCASTNLDHIPGDGAFWHKLTRRMYVTRQGLSTVLWTRPNGPSFTFPQQVFGQWPADNSVYQLHVASTPPVNMSGSSQFKFASLLTQEPGMGAAVSDQRYTASGPGRSLLLIAPGTDPAFTNIYFQFVKTIVWNDPLYFRDNSTANIGEPIIDPAHNPACGSPYVFDYLTPNYPWRFAALPNFYNRVARTGPIIPVNRSASGTRADDLLLVLYQTGSRLKEPLTGLLLSNTVAWPYQPSRYLSVWPTNADQIFIAGGQGSGPVMVPDKSWKVYRQPDTGAYGYNPNEEHAFRLGAPPPLLKLNVSATAISMVPGGSVPVVVSISGDPAFAPQNPIIVSVTGSREGDTNIVALLSTNAVDQELVFAPTNWQSPQLVTFYAGTNEESGSTVFSLRASGGLSALATVTASRVASAPLSIVADYVDFGIPESASRPVNLRLSGPPPSQVTLVTTNRGAPSDSQVLQVQSGGTLIFNQTNWFIPQTVVLRAVEDADSGFDTALFVINASGGLQTSTRLNVTQLDTTPAQDAVYALRNDLGDGFDTPTPATSEPYVLVAYTNALREGRMKVYRVLAEDANHRFESRLHAGQLLQPPYPLVALPDCPQTAPISGPYFTDRNRDYWARSAAIVDGLPAPTNIVMHYYYHPFATGSADGFDQPQGAPPYTGSECLPWLDYYASTVGTPIDYNFVITWPDDVPELRVGETLVKPKFGLPNIASQCSVEVIYEQAGTGRSVQLYDPLAKRILPVSGLSKLPTSIVTEVDPADQKLVFMEVPLTLRKRIKFNPNTSPAQFEFGGYYNDTDFVGEPLLLPNVMTALEAQALKSLSADPTYRNAVDQLWRTTVDAMSGVSSLGSQFKALSASSALGQGYVTLAMQNRTACGALPVSLEIIKVSCPLYRGDLKAIYADCAFDEALTLRHSADFAGQGDLYEYEWFYRKVGDVTWIKDPTQTGPDFTIRGPGLRTLEDYQYYCHYRPVGGGLCGTGWSPDTNPQLAEGWIKRVLRGVNPFTQINTDYHSTTVDTTANMIQQAGPRWGGNIALNCLPGNNFGLIGAYETIFRRGIDLSIGAGFTMTDDTALRLAAGQLCDLYMLLGNEAYADAQDPTVGFGTEGGQYTATSVHCLQGQTASLLDEELALLRGRDGPFGSDQSLGTRVDIPPVYNRLYWNFGPDQAGQAAYVLNYNITDKNGSGTIDATDARLMFPQGHGDAWGHYLTAINSFYRLFSNSNYTWLPQFENVNINGADVQVNYQYERKFAKAAAARSRTGAEIVGLTYRSLYVEDPAGQWQGYPDVANTNRAWGVSDWASRAGQAALFDWIAGNTLLPAQDLVNPPLSKVDRTTVTELREVASSFIDIQQGLDNADQGLNPLGLEKEVVPFGIDPGALTSGQTHFDQIYTRAMGALNNAVAVFNHANEPTQLLRKQQDTVADFTRNVTERLNDFTNRLIEIFGYPYNEDIGGGGAYPAGYVGPDLFHFNYVDVLQLSGVEPPTRQSVTLQMQDLAVADDGTLFTNSHPVTFDFSSERNQLLKPPGFNVRQAPGEIQRALGDLTQARVRLEQALRNYGEMVAQIEDQARLIAQQYAINAREIIVLNTALLRQRDLNEIISKAHERENTFRLASRSAAAVADAMAEFLPKSVGLSVDATSVGRGIIRLEGALISEALNKFADEADEVQLANQQDKEDAQATSNIELTTIHQEAALLGQIAQLKQLVRQEAVQRYELYNLRETVTQAAGNYASTLARGYRIVEDRVRFLQETAAQVQAYRYKDMAFRIFRNDALQKYRAQFDLAARYVYLAAKAYDYETGLLQTSTKAGSAFLEDIVKKRAIGTIQNGVPLPGTTGDSGLAATMAAMSQDYATIKANFGINNQISRQRLFSLRNGWFRIGNAATNSVIWRETLRRQVVGNIWDIPEFQRYCRPLRLKPSNGHEPGIVISFPSMIVAENNFFG